MGPTASGKTDLALALAKQLPLYLISVDSAMIYRGMDIGSAKPDATTLAEFPHALVDIIDPTDLYSVGQFIQDAKQACQKAWSQHKIPFFVGGTMMYFKALLQGLDATCPSDPKVKAQLITRLKQQGVEVLYQELSQVDPVYAQKIQPQDSQRVIRALEVLTLSGLSIESFWGKAKPIFQKIYTIGLVPSKREWLHQRIEQRLHIMWAQGLVDEVRDLLEKWPVTADHPAMRAVGYRQVHAYLNGQLTDEELKDKTLFATRQLAKRQLTWLRKLQLDWSIDPTEANDDVAALITAFMKSLENE